MSQEQILLPANATPESELEAAHAATDRRIAGIAYRAKLNSGGEMGLNRTPGLAEEISQSAIEQAAAEGYDVSHLIAPAEPTPVGAPVAPADITKPSVPQTVYTDKAQEWATTASKSIDFENPSDQASIVRNLAPRHAGEVVKPWYKRSVQRAMGTAALVGLALGALGGGLANGLRDVEGMEQATAGLALPIDGDLAKRVSHEQTHERSIDYLFDNAGKETPYAFGPAGDATSVENALADLKDRYQKDPALVAAHAAANGFIGYEEVDSYTAKFASDFESWDAMSSRLTDRYKDMTFSVGNIPDGSTNSVWFADANNDGTPELRQSVADLDGTALIGVDNQTGEQLVYRADCGWQSREKSEINVPILIEAAPEVMPAPESPESPTNIPPIQTFPETPREEGLEPKHEDKNFYQGANENLQNAEDRFENSPVTPDRSGDLETERGEEPTRPVGEGTTEDAAPVAPEVQEQNKQIQPEQGTNTELTPEQLEQLAQQGAGQPVNGEANSGRVGDE